MSRVVIRTRGVQDFIASSQAFLIRQTTYANRGLDAIAHLAKDEAEANCPVDTGYMRDHHGILDDMDGPYRYVRYLYNETPYAIFVHEGTYKMAPRPWFLNAVNATSSQFVTEMMRV